MRPNASVSMNEGILQMNMKQFALATTALVGGLMVAGAASAQSTASQATEVDKVVVTASGQRAVSGLIAETAPKSKSTINKEFIDKQQAGQTILDTLNQTPGLSFTKLRACRSPTPTPTVRRAVTSVCAASTVTASR